MFLMTFAIWIGAEVFRTDIQRCSALEEWKDKTMCNGVFG